MEPDYLQLSPFCDKPLWQYQSQITASLHLTSNICSDIIMTHFVPCFHTGIAPQAGILHG